MKANLFKIMSIVQIFTMTLLTSCATIVNRPYKYVTVHTTEQSKIIYRQDTIKTVDNKAHLKVERKRESLSIVAITDSLVKPVEIKYRYAIMYWSNILFNYGIGMLVDMKNSKRYSYPDKVYINSADVANMYYKYGKANNKGELYLHLSLPTINPVLMKVESEGIKAKTGVGGVTVGFDYYHSKKQFIHLGISGLFGGFSLRNGNFESLTTEYISFSNNHKITRFSIGYGFSFARNTWEYHKWRWFLIPIPVETITKTHNSFGFIFPAYFQLGEYFNVGVVYMPTFYRPNIPDKFVYEHLISIDLAWKIRLKK